MDEIKVRVGKASDAKSASSVNQRRLQRSTTLNRRFVKKPSPVPRIRSSASAASRALKTQQPSGRRILISKGQAVKIQPRKVEVAAESSETIQQTEKIVQRAEQQLVKQAQPKTQDKLINRATSNTVTLKGLSDIQAPKTTTAKATPKKKPEPIAPAKEHAIMRNTRARMMAKRGQVQETPKLTAQELKEQAIQRALQKVSTMSESEAESEQLPKRHFWQKKKTVAAMAMAVVALALFGYLVSINLPDISVRVAAMHSGIEKAYPSYVPSTYRLDGLVKEEDGRLTMSFKNDRDQSFNLVEEKTSWDSSAVLTNYVLKNWGADYTIVKGQGLTIYISGSKAAWVNGGVLYVITDDSNSLTANNLHDIAVSF